MRRKDQEKAERLSQYIDQLLTRAKGPDGASDSSIRDDDDLEEFGRLAKSLGDIEILPPTAFEEELACRLSTAREAELDGGPLTSAVQCLGRLATMLLSWARVVSPGARAAVATAFLAAIVGVAAVSFLTSAGVSAAEILNHSSYALANLARPGEVLYRRWDVVYVRTKPSGERSRQEQIVHEWMDGSMHGRTAGRSYGPDGQLLWAYADVPESDGFRPHIYLSTGYGDEADAVLNIEPTQSELRQALKQFPPNERHLLETYLERGYIYHPIVGDHQFNRVALHSQMPDTSKIPRAVLSLDTSLIGGGARVRRVRILDPMQVRLTWRSRKARQARVETVRYIAEDSYLSLRAEERVAFESGLQVSMTWEMIETRIEKKDTAGWENPFELDVLPGTPVRRHSPLEVLSSYGEALQRVAAHLN